MPTGAMIMKSVRLSATLRWRPTSFQRSSPAAPGRTRPPRSTSSRPDYCTLLPPPSAARAGDSIQATKAQGSRTKTSLSLSLSALSVYKSVNCLQYGYGVCMRYVNVWVAQLRVVAGVGGGAPGHIFYNFINGIHKVPAACTRTRAGRRRAAGSGARSRPAGARARPAAGWRLPATGATCHCQRQRARARGGCALPRRET